VLALACAACLMAASAAQAADADADGDLAERSRALGRASAAVVGVRATAVEGATSARTLGGRRQGSGIVIGDDGLVLTIGYLVLEAQQVQLDIEGQRAVPARVLGYDPVTGFGLVQALTPLRIEPVPLGRAGALQDREALMVASGGEDGDVAMAQLVSRRTFAGYWEYLIDDALFTSPPSDRHSGAGLFNPRGELVGVGSLFVTDALGPGQPALPGNMFVPVDLLRPILAELRSRGTSQASHRAWLGLNCVEHGPLVHVVRGAEDSPAQRAGIQRGDRIVSLDDTEVDSLATLWKTLWAGGAAERSVTLKLLREGEPVTVQLRSVDRLSTLRRPEGV
jgi:S1-C subfamily serine protease